MSYFETCKIESRACKIPNTDEQLVFFPKKGTLDYIQEPYVTFPLKNQKTFKPRISFVSLIHRL